MSIYSLLGEICPLACSRKCIVIRFLCVALLMDGGRESCATEPDTEGKAPAWRVMSFNIRNGIANDGPNRWQLRKDLVIRTVRDFDPDILGTQEVRGFQAAYLRAQLSDYGIHGASRLPSDKEEEQCAVLFRKARFERLEAGHFWLSTTPDNPGSKSWDSSLPRMVSWVQVRDRASAKICYVFNTHFDHVGREARLQAAALVRHRVQQIAGDSPSIVLGDFNSREDSLPHQILLYSTPTLRLHDTYRARHPTRQAEEESTLSHWKGNRAGHRIDWILASHEWQILAAGITHSHEEGRYPSDHYPVTAILRLSARSP